MSEAPRVVPITTRYALQRLTSALFAIAPLGLAAQVPAIGTRVEAPALPVPVTNNAVATITRGPGAGVYSMLGVDGTKTWRGITRRAFFLARGTTTWSELPPVPGAAGRLASLAFGVRNQVYLFGGYTVDSSGAERSLPNVDIWDPVKRMWRSGAPMPVAVDDAVGGLWRDSLIVIVSGWHDTDNVADVQWYDPAHDRWTKGTPFPGVPVFGGAGSVLGDQLLVLDGARRAAGKVKYTLASQAWLGTIDHRNPARIRWDSLPAHPGPARYRAAVGACRGRFHVAGGTDNPYNYNGIGYDGRASIPEQRVLSFDVTTRTWRAERDAPLATMDHRSMAIVDGAAWLVGGMRAHQIVADDVAAWAIGCPTPRSDATRR